MVHWGDVAEWVTAGVAAVGLTFTYLAVRSNAISNKDRLFEESYDAANGVWAEVTQSRQGEDVVGLLAIYNTGRRAVFGVYAVLMTKDGNTFAEHPFEEVPPPPAAPSHWTFPNRDDIWDGAGGSTAVINLTFDDPWGNQWQRKNQGRLHAIKNKWLRRKTPKTPLGPTWPEPSDAATPSFALNAGSLIGRA